MKVTHVLVFFWSVGELKSSGENLIGYNNMVFLVLEKIYEREEKHNFYMKMKFNSDEVMEIYSWNI